MLNVTQFRELVIRPALKCIGLHSDAAENLVLGTALQESALVWLRQLGGGPAIGLYQMEPATHRDIWVNWLEHRPELSGRVQLLIAPRPDLLDQLVTNPAYATAMCRIHYLRVPAPLPDANDVPALAGYWKRYYNTLAGAGSEIDFISNYTRYTEPEI